MRAGGELVFEDLDRRVRALTALQCDAQTGLQIRERVAAARANVAPDLAIRDAAAKTDVHSSIG